MKRALVVSILQELENDIPPDFDRTIICVHQREGAMSLFVEMDRWTPEFADKEEANEY